MSLKLKETINLIKNNTYDKQTLKLVKFIKNYNQYVIPPEEMKVLYPSLLEALKTNTTITSLNVSDCDYNCICKYGKYNIIQDNINLLAEVLKTNKYITSLNLRLNCLNNINSILEVLKTNNTLISLNISYNGIVFEDDNLLIYVLKTNKTLTSLNLTSIKFKNIDSFLEALKTNTTLLH